MRGPVRGTESNEERQGIVGKLRIGDFVLRTTALLRGFKPGASMMPFT